jgi:hypothetical protein
MTVSTQQITETPDAFIVNGITIPKMKRGQLNQYDPAIIKAIGAELFFELVSPKKPIPIPDLGFSEAEWDDLEAQIRNDQ